MCWSWILNYRQREWCNHQRSRSTRNKWTILIIKQKLPRQLTFDVSCRGSSCDCYSTLNMETPFKTFKNLVHLYKLLVGKLENSSIVGAVIVVVCCELLNRRVICILDICALHMWVEASHSIIHRSIQSVQEKKCLFLIFRISVFWKKKSFLFVTHSGVCTFLWNLVRVGNGKK